MYRKLIEICSAKITQNELISELKHSNSRAKRSFRDDVHCTASENQDDQDSNQDYEFVYYSALCSHKTREFKVVYMILRGPLNFVLYLLCMQQLMLRK